MTYTELKSAIQRQAYAEVPIECTAAELERGALNFLEFLTLPLEIKEQINFRIDPESHRTQVGYVRRHKDLGHGDNKEYFHYHALARERFVHHIKDEPLVQAFFDAAEHIYCRASDAASRVIHSMEEKIPGIHDIFFPPDDVSSLFLRFLKYDPRGHGDFLARGHYDTGDLTLALAESAPGLRIGRHDKDVREVPPRTNGKALFMPAMRFSEFSDDFPPAWHDVIQKEEHQYSDTCARWAIVLFIDHSKINRESTVAAHTPKYE